MKNPLRIIWTPYAGYLIAAVLVVALLLRPTRERVVEKQRTIPPVQIPYPAALLETEFLPSTATDTLRFNSPTGDCYLFTNFKADLHPEREYTLRLLKLQEPQDSTIMELFNTHDFDSTSMLHFTVLIDTGRFVYRLYEQGPKDTVVISHPFTIDFRP